MAHRDAKALGHTPEDPVRYEIGDELAAGGMGTVYRGFDRLAQRPIAYKRIKVTNESSRSRMSAVFKREYDTLAHLTHPNIVDVFEFGFDAFGPFYTMELLSGDDLADVAPLSVAETCRLMRDVGSALALLHARRLVHRDVGPNNVRLTADGRAKLIDFGGLTKFGAPLEVIGTPAFIAPECLSDASLDGRTDLYALGALTYWTLTRRTHVYARTLDGLCDAWALPVVPPSQYVPEVPKALDELVLALLSHDPVARPATAAHVIERLTAIAGLPPEDDERHVAYSYLQHAPLRGREQPLADVHHALERVIAGEGEVVLVESEPGLGRTALLDQLAVEAQLAGATVVRAQGSLHNTPFSAARALVETGMGIYPDVAQRARKLSSYFTQGIAGPAVRSGHSTMEVSERQGRLTAHLQDALTQLSLRNPLVLLVDDVQGIDPESLSLFAAMLEVLRGHPILLVLTAQVDVPAQQPQAYAKLAANAKRCKLTPLSAQHTADLVTGMFGGVPNSNHLAAWLFEQTGGSPAQIIDLAKLLLADGKIRYTIGTFTLPYAFEEISAGQLHESKLRASVSGLGATASRLAYLLGIHPGPLSTAQIVSASALRPPEVVQTMEDLVHRGVAVVSGDSYSCASENLRAALRGSRSESDMREARLALARTFSQYDLEVLEYRLAVVYHLLHAGGAEAFEGACLLARTRDDQKSALAMSPQALVLLERALALLKARGESDEACVGLLIPLSMAGFYGEFQAQERYLERAMNALWKLCGIVSAQRLRRFLGARLSLVFGLLWGFVTYLIRPPRQNAKTFAQLLESLGSVAGTATAATACTWDVAGSYRIASYLDPFGQLSKRGALSLIRAFCLANADLVAVKLALAAARYAELFEAFSKPVPGLGKVHAANLRDGCLHGQAQALVTDCNPEALAIAEQLEACSPFFAPHVEGIRMSYHAYRGEMHKAAIHRERAEALAFRGGTAWSATGVLILRSIHACILTGDVVGLVHVMAHLERFAKSVPQLAAIARLTAGHLEQMRGHPERAIAIYEQSFADEYVLRFPSYPVERALHAQALSTMEDYAGAKSLCLQLLDEIESSGRDSELIFLSVREQLAIAEAGLGNHERAAEVLACCFARAGRHGNPRALGGVHRVRAYVAALAGDRPGFEEHFAAMSALYRQTENPWLLQQCDVLHAQAVRLGVATSALGHARQEEDLDGATALEVRDRKVPPEDLSGTRSEAVTARAVKPARSSG